MVINILFYRFFLKMIDFLNFLMIFIYLYLKTGIFMKTINLLLVLLMMTSCSKNIKDDINKASEISQPNIFEQKLTMTNTSLTDPNAAEMFDVGTAPLNGVKNARLWLINNVTNTTLKLSMADMFSKFAQTTRWQVKMVNGVQSTGCGASLAANASCYVDVQLNYVTAAEDYSQPVEVNFVSGANPTRTSPTVACPTGFDVSGSNCIPHSTQIGKILFTGMKAADPIITQVPALNVLKISTLSDTFILKPAQTISKRYYIGNSQNPLLVSNAQAIILPTIVPPVTGIISQNTCTGIISLSPLKTCYFEVSYSYNDLTPNLSETVGFTSNSANLNTTGLEISLAIISQPAIAPVQAASFVQVGKISDLTSTTQSERIYVTNTGSSSADFTQIVIPSPYVITKTSCTNSVLVGSKCFIDIKVDPLKTTNMTGIATPISYGSNSTIVTAGVAVTVGQTLSCKAGFVAQSNGCVAASNNGGSKIAAGWYSSCYIDTLGKIFCFGSNTFGELGNGSYAGSQIPVAVDMSGVLSGKTALSIEAGDNNYCIIANDNLPYCWGSNSNGQLGNGNKIDSNVPVAVNMAGLSGKTVKQISLGSGSACIITNDNLPYCWGSNSNGQLGTAIYGDNISPVSMDLTGALLGLSIKSVGIGAFHSCVLASNNNVYCSGDNILGQLGTGNNSVYNSPTIIDMTGALAGKTILELSVNGNQSCVIASDNLVYCFGLAFPYNPQISPTIVDSLGITFSHIISGDGTSCGISITNKAYCFGYDFAGMLGNGTIDMDSSILSPVDTTGVLANKNIQEITIGSGHVCSLSSDNLMACWGYNSDGQLGNGTVIDSSIPINVLR
jgi:alpha-tubulin suppressor-like RCC1 family protein